MESVTSVSFHRIKTMDKLEEIARRLAEIDDPELMERFFREILTPKEVRDLSSRWELVKLFGRRGQPAADRQRPAFEPLQNNQGIERAEEKEFGSQKNHP